VAVGVKLVGVGHIPSTASVTIVIRDALRNSLVLSLLRVEGVTVEVLLTTDSAFASGSIGLEDSIGGAIDIRIEP